MKIRGIIMTTALILAIIAVFTTTAAALSCSDGDICVNPSGWWRDGGTLNASGVPIQAAVDNAAACETICVAAGSYTENVHVNKRLTLRGEGADLVTVTAANSGDHVFEVTADYVNISGFTATGATADYWLAAGFYLYGVDHCNIYENDCSYNSYGIYIDSSSNNTLTSNNADSNRNFGICLYSSSNNTLVSNTANSNDIGICLWSSSNNTLLNNDNLIYNNYYGICLLDSSNNVLTSNTASNDFGGIHLCDSSNNTLTSNNCSNNYYYGILLDKSSNNTLTSNTANSNRIGIILYSSNNDNLIYNNYFNNYYFNNTVNAGDDGSNQWNITKTSGTNIIGGPFLGGNYWSDYAGNDTDGDGLGDTMLPYDSSGNIQNGGDYHPLVSAAEPPLDEPPAFTTADALIALRIAVGSCPFDSHYDVSGDGQVTSLDSLMIAMDARTG